MLRSVQGLKGSTVIAVDGDVGTVDEFFFDDEQWTVRYLVADTGGWLTGQRILISPMSLGRSDWRQHTLYVDLTRDQIRNAPGVDTERPVSRQWEVDYYNYYGWPYYWGGAGIWGPAMYPAVVPPAVAPGGVRGRYEEDEEERPEDSHLRSSEEVTGYSIQCPDGDLGHVEDFIVDDENWVIRYLAVDTRNWWPGKKVLLPPQWIDSVSWTDRAVFIELQRETVRNAPEWDPGAPISRDYERRLHDYYGHPHYWEHPDLRRAA